MKRLRTIFLTLTIILVSTTNTLGQIYAPEGLHMPGGWDGWSNPPTNPVFAGEAQTDYGELKLVELGLTSMYQTTFEVAADGDVAAGDYEFKFTSGPLSNPWNNAWGSVGVSINTLQDYQFSGANNSITLADNKWYVMNWENLGYQNTRAIFMELDDQPAEFQSVSHAPEVPDPSEQITVSVETDIEPGPAQNVYVRYTDDDWTTSSLEEVSFTGTSGEAVLAGFPANTTIEYYVFSTNQESPTQDIDLKTVRFDNNGGDNYTVAVSDEYTVTFSVTDGTNPVQGATVDVNDTQLTTDVSGEATINLLNGDYPYTVMADGFVSATGTITVNGSDITEDVVLEQAYDVTFNVDMSEVAAEEFDPATDDVYLSGIMFGWPEPGTDPNLKMTDADDDMIYTIDTALAAGTYQYKHFILPEGIGSSWEYGEWDGNDREFAVTDAPVTLDNIFGHFVTEFHVINESDEDIEGATVEVNGESLTTDASGMASTPLPPNNIDGYDYEVSAASYANALGNVMVDFQDVYEEVTMSPPAEYTLTFDVMADGSPVEGAVVDINDTQLTTNASGEATIELENGNYPYTVSADGFMNAYGDVTVNDNPVTEEVTMSEGYAVTFNVDMSESAPADFDPATDEVYVTGGPFDWSEPGTDPTLELTDADDDMVYSLDTVAPVGTHEYKYFYVPEGEGSSWDYGEWAGGDNRTFELTDAPITLDDIWGNFLAEFHVINESDENIEGATVEVNGESLTTDASGMASTILPPDNTYDYEVSAEGYSNALGSLQVNYQNVYEEVTLTEPTSFMVTFQVSDGEAPVEGALISIDGNELTTDDTGEASVELDNGNYAYTITAEGYMDSYGEVTIDGSDVTEDAVLTEGYAVTFNVDMSESAPADFDPATDEVYVTGGPFDWSEPGTDPTLELTDADDDMVYSLDTVAPVGTHEYKYFYVPEGEGSSWDYGEWAGGDNRTFELTDAPITLDDIWGNFLAEFHVINESDEDIEGATVEVNGESLTTDASGMASTALPPNNTDGYDYEVSEEGYANSVGNIMVDYQDVEEEVTMYPPEEYAVIFNVTDQESNPVQGAIIDINDTQLTTNASGEATIYQGNGNYPYTVTAEGYVGASGEVTVNGSNVTEEVILSEGYMVSFNVDMSPAINSGDFDPATEQVFVSGSPFGWPEPGTVAGLELLDSDDDQVYTLDTLVAIGNHDYKYFYVPDGTGSSWDYGEWDTEDNRTFEVGDEPLTLNDIWGAFAAEFHVINPDEEPIEGATIAINDEELTTNAAGMASTALPPNNTEGYDYEVTAEGYATYADNLEVDYQDVSEEIILYPPADYTVSFHVDMTPAAESSDFDPATDAVYVTGSAFGWNEPGTDATLQLTDPDGDMIYSLDTMLAVGNHEYKYFYVPGGTGSSWDYGEWDGEENRQVEVTDSDIVLDEMWGHFMAEFHVVNDSDEDIEGATVSVNGEDLTTDTGGMAATYLPPNNVDGYDYEVVADGYANAFGNILVDYEDVLEEVTMSAPASYTVTFNVTDGTDPVEGAVVDINDTQLTTDAAGVATIDLENGSYPYTVTADDFVSVSGEVVVNGDDVTEDVVLSMGYMTTFNVDMSTAVESTDFDPETDAVYISGDLFGWVEPGNDESLMMTDENDDLIYTLDTLVEPGMHEYKYFYLPGSTGSSWEYGEWEAPANRVFEVSDAPVTRDDIWANFTLTFHVANEADGDIQGANIAINGENLTTNAGGMASTILPPNDGDGYDYEVTATGYQASTGNVMVNFADTLVDVTLQAETTYAVTFMVMDGQNPLADASVSLEGYGEMMTDGSGEAVFEDVAPADSIYYTVSASGFQMYEDSLQVVDQDVYEEVMLIATGVGNDFLTSLKAYPNPVEDVLYIKTATNDEFVMEVINANGQVVQQREFAGQTEVNASGWSSGLFIIRLTSDEGSRSIRIIKPESY